MSLRRYHDQEPGYVEERLNYRVPNDRIVIYLAADRRICIGSKYAIVCKAHGAVAGAWTLQSARNIARHPYSFCDDCRALRNANVKSTRQGGFRKLKTYHPPDRRSGYEGRTDS